MSGTGESQERKKEELHGEVEEGVAERSRVSHKPYHKLKL